MIVITMSIVTLNTGSSAQRNTVQNTTFTEMRTLIGFESHTQSKKDHISNFIHYLTVSSTSVSVRKSSGNSVINSHNKHYKT